MLVYLEKRQAIFWVISGIGLVLVIGAIDAVTGKEISISLFYLIPIMFVTWFRGRNFGLVMSVICAVTWLTADILAGQSYSNPAIRFWNSAVRLGFFISVTLLLPALKALRYEQTQARVDYLTGAANRRSLFETVQQEVDRSRRYGHPFTLAFLDLDDFKVANDRLGHVVGDAILCAVVEQTRRHLRKTDMIARVGGDEFILLLPETDRQASKTLIPRIQAALLDEMQRNEWPVTFSIGVLTCHAASRSADELIKRADELMYSVKRSGKNAVAYAECDG